MSFTGFPERALEFYEGLEADNSKAYWTDHKDIYDTAVAGPMKDLLAELSSYGEAKLFRPYRDVRFSKDKTPYKTRQYAVVDGRLYVGIDADGLHLGGGRFHLESAEIARLRAAVDDDRTGAQLVAILDGLKGMTVSGDELKRVPKPWDASHARADLLRRKALVVSVDHTPAPWLHTKKAKDRVAKAWDAVAPLNAWLDQHVAL
jgi:uncharacterized protein (TIGR02453 family)